MDRDQLNLQYPPAVEGLVESVREHAGTRHLNRVYLPSRGEAALIVQQLRQIAYPGYFEHGLTEENLAARLAEAVSELRTRIVEQIRCCLRYGQQIPENEIESSACHECDAEAARAADEFLSRLPDVRRVLATDVQAAFDGDPAATSTDETIFCYPGLFAITVQRFAHEFYKLSVPLLPRMMTELAHSQTGIDIHPGAQLGERFFIDHGTGVVIGETTIIGKNVKVYQGVTLGAVAPAFGQLLRGQKRHPTIEDDVTLYAGATILGGHTTIGRGSVIGGNVFITASVPPQNQVIAEPAKLTYRDRRKRSRDGDGALDFQI